MAAPSSPPTSLASLADAELDVLVVGGGITGACVALDAARRGLRTALVDRGDYGAGATANCLRIVHGGLRYLQHLDLRRSRESILERSMWLRSAPHLVEPLPVVVPTRRGAFPPRWLLGAALMVNEVLSADRNTELDDDRVIPRARVLSRRECVSVVPPLDDPAITGGVLFHDAIMYSPERLTLEVVHAAIIAGATASNHVAFEGIVRDSARVTGARLRDVITGEVSEVRTRWLVNVAGAHAGAVAAQIAGARAAAPPRYSVALNLVTSQPASGAAFTVSGGAGDPDRVMRSGPRQLFVVPWRGQRLVGTAHFPFDGDPAAATLRDADVASFLAEVRTASPPLGVREEDVRLVHWGLLPVAGTDDGDRVRLLKHHRIVDHATDGVAGALSVVSVKFTTARRLAAEVVDRITGARPAPGAGPLALALPGKFSTDVHVAVTDAQRRYAPQLPPDVIEHLVHAYGARFEHVIALGERMREGLQRVTPDAPVIFAQFVHGVRAEGARTVDDLLWRRTELGPRGLVTAEGRRQAQRALDGEGEEGCSRESA